MSHTYFWYQNKLVTFDRRLTVIDFDQFPMQKYRYCPCVDTSASRKAERYGHWAVNDSQHSWPTQWIYRPLESFPPEFRAHLLLLGVT